MATLEQLQAALVNADKAGDTDAARQLAQAIKSMQAPAQPYAVGGPEGRALAMQQVAQEAGPLGAMFGEIGMAVNRAKQGITQLFGANPSQYDQNADALSAALHQAHPAASLAGDVLGNGSMMYLGGTALRGAGALANAANAAKTGAVLTGAGAALAAPKSLPQVMGAGAAYTAATTPGDLGQRAASGAMGALGGMLGYGIGKGAGAVYNAYVAPAVSKIPVVGDIAAALGGPPARGAVQQATASPSMTAQITGGAFGPGVAPAGASPGLTAAQQAAADAGKKLGMRLTPGQASGSVPLQQVEAFLESHPATSGPFATLKASNQQVLNKAAAQAIGENATTVDSAVLGNAYDRIGDVYNALRSTGNRAIDPNKFLTDLSAIESNYEGLIGDGSRSISDNPLVQRYVGYAANGGATAEQLADLASKLTKAARSQMTSQAGDRQLGMALSDVKSMVDGQLKEGLSPQAAAAFDAARAQYRNLMLLTGRSGVVNPSTGNVNARSLASVLQSQDRNGFTFGNGQSDLYNAVRFSQAFQPLVGDSGTATRMGTMEPLQMLLSIPGSVGSYGYLGTANAIPSALNGISNAKLGGILGYAAGANAANAATQQK